MELAMTRDWLVAAWIGEKRMRFDGMLGPCAGYPHQLIRMPAEERPERVAVTRRRLAPLEILPYAWWVDALTLPSMTPACLRLSDEVMAL